MFAFLDKNLHYVYALIALALGVSMALLTPPTAVPDETAHMTKIAAVSGGALVGIPLGGRIPAIGLGYANIYDKVIVRDPLIVSEDISAAFRSTIGMFSGNIKLLAIHSWVFPATLFFLSTQL